MIGSGRLALPVLEPAVAQHTERVLVYSPSGEKRAAFALKASKHLKISVIVATSAEQAMDEADLFSSARTLRPLRSWENGSSRPCFSASAGLMESTMTSTCTPI